MYNYDENGEFFYHQSNEHGENVAQKSQHRKKANDYIDVYRQYTTGVKLKLFRKDKEETSAEILSSITLGLESKI